MDSVIRMTLAPGLPLKGHGTMGRLQPGRRQAAIAAISVLIAGVLLLQAAASFLFYPLISGVKNSWPFIDYPMYKNPHYEGDRTARLTLVGTLKTGQELPILPADVGTDYWHFRRLLERLERGDDRAALKLAQLYESHGKPALSRLRLEQHDRYLSAGGFSQVQVLLLKRFQLPERAP